MTCLVHLPLDEIDYKHLLDLGRRLYPAVVERVRTRTLNCEHLRLPLEPKGGLEWATEGSFHALDQSN